MYELVNRKDKNGLLSNSVALQLNLKQEVIFLSGHLLAMLCSTCVRDVM